MTNRIREQACSHKGTVVCTEIIIMTMIKWFLLAALSAAMAVPFARPVIAGEFADVLDTPALPSELAARSTLTGLTHAGDRLVAVGQRGHILHDNRFRVEGGGKL